MIEKSKVESLVTDVRNVFARAEEAIRAHLDGNLDPSHLAATRDAADAAVKNGEALIAEPAGSPVPDGPTTARTQQEAKVAEDTVDSASEAPSK